LAIEALIARYGLLAILGGAGIEGEAVVITGGILAHRGLLPFWGVAVAAAVGSCAIDQLWFLAGRYFRDRRWVRSMMERPAFARALSVLERHPTKFIFSFRFIYGLRTISPIAIGASAIPARRFVLLNMAAAAIWGPLLTWIGYAFGRAIDPLLRNSQRAVLAVIGVALLVAIILVGVRVAKGLLRRRKE
jgi:membrane protein DedA with SNARE-associated domain